MAFTMPHSTEAIKIIKRGDMWRLFRPPESLLQIHMHAFDVVVGSGNLDALIMLCQLRTHASERFVNFDGRPAESSKLPYRLFCMAVVGARMDMLRWMLAHHDAVGIHVQGTEAFNRAAIRGQTEVMRWMFDNRSEFAAPRTKCIATYVALRNLLKNGDRDNAVWFMRNRIAITGSPTMSADISCNLEDDADAIALLFREGALRAESRSVLRALQSRNASRIAPIVFDSKRLYDVVLVACKLDEPLAIELMLSRPDELELDRMLYKKELFALATQNKDLCWIARALRHHVDAFVEVGHLRREMEGARISTRANADDIERVERAVAQIAWDPKPVIDSVLLLIVSSMAHELRCSRIKGLLNRVCASTTEDAPTWLDDLLSKPAPKYYRISAKPN